MRTVGFLHTASVHAAAFGALLEGQAHDLAGTHVVDEALLSDARSRGVDDEIRGRLSARIIELRERGSCVVVCTCSTLGGAAEALSDSVGVPVVRVDRPMAEQAASIGGRIGILVAVESTRCLTRELLQQCLAISRRDAVLVESLCFDAWERFEAGDTAGYVERLVHRAQGLAAEVDVIVLAQASMAAAAPRLADLQIPVLSSPAPAVAQAVQIARAGRA